VELSDKAFPGPVSYGMTLEEYLVGQCIAGIMANPNRAPSLNDDENIWKVSRLAIKQARSIIKEHKDACNWYKGK
jgi:hypothetical protein